MATTRLGSIVIAASIHPVTLVQTFAVASATSRVASDSWGAVCMAVAGFFVTDLGQSNEGPDSTAPVPCKQALKTA